MRSVLIERTRIIYIMNNNFKFSKNELENIIKESYSIADVCRRCGWKPQGGNYRTIKRYIDEYHLNTTHFTGQRSNIGNKNNKHNEVNVEKYLTEKSYVKIDDLKYKLIKEGYKEYRCEKCGLNKWNGEQISLQLHHINGNNTDNRIENLMLLCPNCHSQTDNFCGSKNSTIQRKYYCKSCGKEINKTKTRLCDECYEKLINNDLENINYSKYNKEIKIFGYCNKCGKELHSKTKYGLCSKCANEEFTTKVKNKPTKEELFNMIQNKSFVEIGRNYNVSSNTIKKWCLKYNLPYRKKDINKNHYKSM